MEADNKSLAPVNTSESGGSLGTPIPGCLEAAGAVPGLTAREVQGKQSSGAAKGRKPRPEPQPHAMLGRECWREKPRGCTRRGSGPQHTPHGPQPPPEARAGIPTVLHRGAGAPHAAAWRRCVRGLLRSSCCERLLWGTTIARPTCQAVPSIC